MKLSGISALGVACLVVAASQPAQAASVVVARDFTFSKTISNEGSGALTPAGGMSATFGPIGDWGDVYDVHITWTYFETFDGVAGGGASSGGGISFSFGGNAAVDTTAYDGAGSGNGAGGPAGDVINIFAQKTMQDDFRRGQDPANILGLMTGSNPFTVSWNLNSNDAYSTGYGAISGTLSGTGRLSMIINFTPAPEPATWAMMLVGFGAVGAVARNRRRAAPAV